MWDCVCMYVTCRTSSVRINCHSATDDHCIRSEYVCSQRQSQQACSCQRILFSPTVSVSLTVKPATRRPFTDSFSVADSQACDTQAVHRQFQCRWQSSLRHAGRSPTVSVSLTVNRQFQCRWQSSLRHAGRSPTVSVSLTVKPANAGHSPTVSVSLTVKPATRRPFTDSFSVADSQACDTQAVHRQFQCRWQSSLRHAGRSPTASVSLKVNRQFWCRWQSSLQHAGRHLLMRIWQPAWRPSPKKFE